MSSRDHTDPASAGTPQPRQYRIVSGPVGIGAIVTALQYVGGRDTLVAIVRMLGQDTVQFGHSLPGLWFDGEPVPTGSWVTVCAGDVEVIEDSWFAEHYRPIDHEVDVETRLR